MEFGIETAVYNFLFRAFIIINPPLKNIYVFTNYKKYSTLEEFPNWHDNCHDRKM